MAQELSGLQSVVQAPAQGLWVHGCALRVSLSYPAQSPPLHQLMDVPWAARAGMGEWDVESGLQQKGLHLRGPLAVHSQPTRETERTVKETWRRSRAAKEEMSSRVRCG